MLAAMKASPPRSGTIRASGATMTLAILLPLVVACSPYTLVTTQPTLPVSGFTSPNLGTVCVIRSSPFARLVTFAIHDNAQLVGATRGDSYFCYLAEPGTHTIVSDTADSVDTPGALTLEVAPSGRYWVRQDHRNRFGSIASELEVMSEAAATALVASCEYKILARVPSGERLPEPVPLATSRLARY
jgi:hypothetical protein